MIWHLGDTGVLANVRFAPETVVFLKVPIAPRRNDLESLALLRAV